MQKSWFLVLFKRIDALYWGDFVCPQATCFLKKQHFLFERQLARVNSWFQSQSC